MATKKPPGPKPGMTTEEREKRNTLVMQMFLAGWTEREIGKNPRVELTGAAVHNVIKTELQKSAQRHQLLSDKALQVYVERLEIMLKSAWPQAVQGELKAIETVRRILEQQGRLYDLEEMGKLPTVPPVNDKESDEHQDELSKHRARRHGPAAG